MRASSLRRSYLLAALFGAALLVLSCGGDSGGGPPEPSSVTVTPGSDTLFAINETKAFTAEVLDDNAHAVSGAVVSWTSSDSTVVSIDAASGLATARKNGQSTIQAHVGELLGSANAVVVQIVTSVTVTPANVAFTAVGDTARFTAVGKDAGNSPVAGVQILWSVSDNAVATIDTLGLAKSKGAGNALVSAQVQTRAGYAAIGVAPAVTQFVVLGGPTTGVAGDPFSTALQVELRDAHGSRVMDASLPVTVAPAGAAFGTPIHGTTTIITDAGRATFTNLWLEKAGVDRLEITVGALPVDSTSLVTVSPAVPAAVHLDSLAQFQTAGVPIGLVARLYDRFGNPATNSSAFVVAELTESQGGGALFGAVGLSAVSGVATFSTLNFHLATAPYRVMAYLPAIPTTRDTSRAMAVFPGPASSFVLEHLGAVGLGGSLAGDSTAIRVADAYGNFASADSLGDTLVVSLSTAGWAYDGPPQYQQQVQFGGDPVLVNGHATLYPWMARPGRTRMVFSLPGFIPDTTEEVIPALPQQEIFTAAASQQSSVIITDRTTCLVSSSFSSSYCAGSNDHGLLGVDSTVVPLDSLFISADSTFNGITGGGDGGDHHACESVSDYFTSEWHVACWGDNSDGQLGGGSVGGESVHPVVVAGPTATDEPFISAGGAHTCALYEIVAYCWGKNSSGQLGTGSAGASTGTASVVTGAHAWIHLSAGGRHTCAIDILNHVWCWGANDYGQLGDSLVSGAFSATPVLVSLQEFSEVAAGEDFTCASVPAAFTHTVMCWGRNDRNQTNPDLPLDSLVIVPTVAHDFIGGPLGLFAGAAFACASSAHPAIDARVNCWGANDHGQLARGNLSPQEAEAGGPIPAVGDGVDFLFVILGRDHACGLTSDSSPLLLCWGSNTDGQFGVGRSGVDAIFGERLQAQY